MKRNPKLEAVQQTVSYKHLKLTKLVSSIKMRTGIEFQIEGDRLEYKGGLSIAEYRQLNYYLTKNRINFEINNIKITIQ